MNEPLGDNNDEVGSIVDELERLAQLRDQGDITEDDYRTLKARIIEDWAKPTTDSPDPKMVAATDDPYDQLPTSIWTSGLEDYSVDVLGLGTRARTGLRRTGIMTVGELDSMTDRELLVIPNMGIGSVNEIRTKLQSFEAHLASGDWDNSLPVVLEPKESRQDWLRNLSQGDDEPIGALGLDPTLTKFLESKDIQGIAGLVAHTEHELAGVNGLGLGKITKIRTRLERFGWRLGNIGDFPEGLRQLRLQLADQTKQAEYAQREARNLVWPLVSNGLSVDQILQSTGLSESAVREARNAWMVNERWAGASHSAIAEIVGLSPEAVRRSIMRSGGPDFAQVRELKANRQADHVRQLRGLIRRVVVSMPGASVREIAQEAGIDENDVRPNLTRLGTKLVRDLRTHEISPLWTDEHLLQALRIASTKSTPLTVAAYDALVAQNQIDGPTGQTFYKRFGSWREACEEAGVQCGEAARANYVREWSEADLRAVVVNFLFSPEHDGHLNSLEKWLEEQPDAPSIATIQKRLGKWGSMKQKAIEEIEAAGRLAELCDLCD